MIEFITKFFQIFFVITVLFWFIDTHLLPYLRKTPLAFKFILAITLIYLIISNSQYL